MLRGQLGEAFTQHFAAILHLQDLVWSVGTVLNRLALAFVELQLIKTWANRESLVTRDRKDPGQDRRAALKSAGARLADLTSMTIFVTDIRDMAAVTKALATALKGSVVTSTLVAVSALAVPGLLVEIEVMGVVER